MRGESKFVRGALSFPPLSPVPCPLFPVPCPLFPVPSPVFPVPSPVFPVPSPLIAEQKRADGQEAVEPAPGLVEGFADEVGRKLAGEALVGAFLAGIPPLGEGHGPGVEPAVDHLGDATHSLARRLGGVVGDRVDVRLVGSAIGGRGDRRAGGDWPSWPPARPRCPRRPVSRIARRSRPPPPCARSPRRPRWAAACPSSVPGRGPNRRSSPGNCQNGRPGGAPEPRCA